MQRLEITLVVMNVSILLWCLFARGRPVWARTAATVALVLAAIQIMFEGHRWQFYPAYIVTAWLVLTLISKRSRSRDLWTIGAGIGGMLVSAVLCSVLPVFRFPTPTGRFPVGTVSRHLVDTSRQETQNSQPGLHRELMIQIWYPAEHHGPGEHYRPRSEMPLKKQHLSLVRTHAASGVPIARKPGRYPVLIFSPAWTGSRKQNTFQVVELASHGFVVVGIDHPYMSGLTVFPDGRVIKTKLDVWLDFSSAESFAESSRVVEDQLRICAADARFVLDTLEGLAENDPAGLLTGHLDTSRVGIFGHSFGGAVAAEACRLDPRFRAAIDLDGCLFGESASAGVEQPFMVMSSQGLPPTASELANSTGERHRYFAFVDRSERMIRRKLEANGGYFLRIEGTRHMNFCDSALYSPLERLTGAGPIDVNRAMRIINDYTLAFFNEFIIDRHQALLSGPAPQYPEAKFLRWTRPPAAAGDRAAR